MLLADYWPKRLRYAIQGTRWIGEYEHRTLREEIIRGLIHECPRCPMTVRVVKMGMRYKGKNS
jgi:hypothetical protein